MVEGRGLREGTRGQCQEEEREMEGAAFHGAEQLDTTTGSRVPEAII